MLVGTSYPSGGFSDWRSEPIERVAEYSPVLALCRARRVKLIPMCIPIVATLTSAQPTSTAVSWSLQQSSDRNISTFCVVQSLTFQIDQPSFAGSAGKSLSDYFFGLQSGIGAMLEIQGRPGYAVSLDTTTPIRHLCDALHGNWPQGWVLDYNQSPTMQFSANVQLLSNFLPLTITVTFCVWTPGEGFLNMNDECALEELDQLGYDLDPRDPSRRDKTPQPPLKKNRPQAG